MDETNPPALDLAHLVVNTLEEKKGEDILLLDLVGVCTFTDFFVLCTARSERTLRALADEVQVRVKKSATGSVRGVEGDPASGWVLVDLGDVIVHLFSAPVRAYYRLEDLWREGQVLLHMR